MRLLASVLSAKEAAAIADIADCIDVKDPSRGALGAPDTETVRAVHSVIPPDAMLSVALGDLPRDSEELIERAREMSAAGAAIVKVGLAGADRKDTREALARVKSAVPDDGRVVAVAYADCDDHRFFSPLRLPALAHEAGLDGILVDTFSKNGGCLFDYFDAKTLRAIIDQARALGLMTALAGSLDVSHIDSLAAIGPDWAGFRAAITSRGRRGEEGVDRGKVTQLKTILANASRYSETSISV